MNALRLVVLLVFFTCTLSVQANQTLCRWGDLERTVEVVYANPGQAVPCEVIYEKVSEGSQRVLWRAFNEAGYCEARAEAFTAKLQGLGWSCDAAGVTDPATVTDEEFIGDTALEAVEETALEAADAVEETVD